VSFEGFRFEGPLRRPAETIRSAFALQAELIEAWGLEGEPQRVAEALAWNQPEMELVDILNFMTRLGFSGAPLKIARRDIDKRLLPCLFLDAAGDISVVTYKNADLNSGAVGKGTAYFFSRIEEHDARDEKDALSVAKKGWFFTVLQRFRFLFAKVTALSLMINFIGLGLPIFLMVIFNRASDITTTGTIFVLGGGAALAIWIEMHLRNLRSKRLAWFAARIDHMASNRVLSRLLQLPAHAIETAPVTSQIARLRAFDSIREFFNGPLFLTMLEIPFTSVGFVALVVLSGWLSLIPAGLLAVYWGLALYFRPRLKISMFEMAKSRSKCQAHHIELFEKLEALRLNGMTEVWQEQYREISAESSLTLFKGQFLSQIVETLVYTITICAGAGLIYLGVLQCWHGHMTGGALFASMMLFWRFIAPWQTLICSIPRIEQLQQSIEQVNRLMTIPTERELSIAQARPPRLSGALSVSRVGLRYTADTDPVFVGLDFNLVPGEMLAISGGNGAGKSTVLKLVMGLYKPQAGAIFLDGSDTRQFNPVLLRQEIAYIPQIPELFIGSIAENLRLARPFASEEQLWEVLEMADAKQAVMALPAMLETSCERLPSALSHQLILARAYLKDSDIMLIDELPYALLNSHAGQMFINRIKSWRGNKTILMVTHRDDYIRMADKALGLIAPDRFVFGPPEQVVRIMRDENWSQSERKTQ
jgi:ATP-binding cassette, subfamily C, bacterial LapB